jgi:hypothetical protein
MPRLGTGSARRLVRSVRVVLSCALGSRSAGADETASARALYDQGSAAYNSGDFARAAALLGDADAAAPNAMVLGLAIGAAIEAGDAVLGEDLALRADARGASGDLRDTVDRAHQRFQARVGRVRIVCARGSECAAHLGSMRWLGGELHAVAPGIVDVVFEGGASHVRISVGAGQVSDLVEPPPPIGPSLVPSSAAVAAEAPRHEARGVSPVWFWGGVVVSAGLAVGAGISGANTHALHDDFLVAPSQATASAGQSAENRTNVLVGTAIAGAVATTVLGIWFTRWHKAPASSTVLSGRIAF